MNQQATQQAGLDAVASAPARRTITIGPFTIRYYVEQPAPTQWVAVGVASLSPSGGRRPISGLVVGTGRSEAQAVNDLKARLGVDLALRPAVRDAALLRRPRRLYRRAKAQKPVDKVPVPPDLYAVPWALHP